MTDEWEQRKASEEASRKARQGKPTKVFSSVAKGFRKRTLVTTKLSAKLGVHVAQKALKSKVTSTLGINKYTGDLEKVMEAADSALSLDLEQSKDREKAAKMAEDAINKAWDLFGDMDQLKGLVMKFGQMASYLSTHMPPEAQRVLAKLQSEASALDYSEVAAILDEELPKPFDEVFDSFEKQALAAASIGQVHKAVYQGRDVAVKIQYPGVEEAIRSDLDLIGAVAPMAKMYKTLFGASINTEELLQELVDRVLEECDYEQEAHNQITAKSVWDPDPKVLIPGVVTELGSRRVIVSEFMEGQNFYDFKELAPQQEKNLAAETLFRMCFESIFNHCFFNGDPHPGNYLFRNNGEVVFLDFGCVIKFPKEFVQNWKGMARSGLEDDREAFKKYTRKMGFVGNEKKFDWDYHWEFYNYALYPVKSDEPFTYTKTYSEYGDELLLYGNKNKMSLKLPKQLLFVNRLQWGLKNILVDLNATIDHKEGFRALVYGEEREVF